MKANIPKLKLKLLTKTIHGGMTIYNMKGKYNANAQNLSQESYPKQ